MYTKKEANPGPLGLMGFGMTTVLLNMHNAGFFPLSAVIISMGIFYGGFAQILAGLLEYKKGNTFPATVFTSFGLFWLSLIGIFLLPKMAWQNKEGDLSKKKLPKPLHRAFRQYSYLIHCV